MSEVELKKVESGASSEEEGETHDTDVEKVEEEKATKRKHSDNEDEGVKKKKKKKEKKKKKAKKAKKEKEAKEKEEEAKRLKDEEEKRKSQAKEEPRRSPRDRRVSDDHKRDRRTDSRERVRDRTRSPRRDDRRDLSKERIRDRTRSPRRDERRDDRRDLSTDSRDRVRDRSRSPRRDDRRDDIRDRRRDSRSPGRRRICREVARRDYSRRRSPSRDRRDHQDDRRRRSPHDDRRRRDDRSDDRRTSRKEEKRERSESPIKLDVDLNMDSDDEEKQIEEMRKRRQEIAKKAQNGGENQSLQGTPQAETEDSEAEEELLREGEAVIGRGDREMRSESPCTSGTDSPMDFIKDLQEKRKATGLDGTLTDEESVKMVEEKNEENKEDKEEEKKEEKANNKKDTEFDMFAEHVAIEEITPAMAVLETVDATNASLKDNWDDAEGYYRVRGGELLDGRYRVKGVVGNGVFGNVVRCDDLERKNTVAIKIARNHDTMRKAGLREAQMLRKLNEADRGDKMHCLQMYSTFDHHNHLCLVFENQSMNLRELLKKYGVKVGLSLSSVRRYSRQLLLALRLLKKCGIVHADIKPDNILVNENKSSIKLCDFGTSGTISEQQLAPLLVSRFYRAPEIMMGIAHDYGIDLWSVAVTIFETYTGKIMFNGDDNNHMLKLFTEVKGAYPNKLVKKGAFKDEHFDSNCNLLYHEKDKITLRDKITVLTNIRPSRHLEEELIGNQRMDQESIAVVKAFANLLDKMLIVDPIKRITVGEALNHPFIRGL